MVFKIRARVEECFKQAEEFFGEEIPRCSVKFDLTGAKGGTAHFAKRKLRFNLKLAVANEGHYLATTVPHEVAHIVQRWKHGYAGVKSHGPEWKKIMIEVFHLPPKVTHSYDTSKVARKTKQYIYHCQCVGKLHSMGKQKHDKIQKKKQACRCLKCGGKLEFEKKGDLPKKTLHEEILD